MVYAFVILGFQLCRFFNSQISGEVLHYRQCCFVTLAKGSSYLTCSVLFMQCMKIKYVKRHKTQRHHLQCFMGFIWSF